MDRFVCGLFDGFRLIVLASYFWPSVLRFVCLGRVRTSCGFGTLWVLGLVFVVL